MEIINTYIVVNLSQVNALKSIQYFKMNLGLALTDNNNRFNPGDINITKHYQFHNKIINLIGYIGTLPIYTDRSINHTDIEICNETITKLYRLNENQSMYDNINTHLKQFFIDTGLKTNVETKTKDTVEITEEYIQPSKPLKDMSIEERILFARNRK